MYNFSYDGHKVGRISLYVETKQSGNKIICANTTVGGKRYRWKLGLSALIAKDVQLADDLAQQADQDIKDNKFDLTLSAYKFKPISNVIQMPVAQTNIVPLSKPISPNLIELVENYISVKTELSNRSLKDVLYTLRVLKQLPESVVQYGDCVGLLRELRTKYTDNTIEHFATYICVSANLAYRLQQVPNNPYFAFISLLNTTRDKDKEIKCFSPIEIQRILTALNENTFKSKYSAKHLTHSFYHPYISFCALTGCRPSEAIALTWGDFKRHSDGTLMISISKAHQGKNDKGIDIVGSTKTGETRFFKANQRLIELIDEIPHLHKDLVFPSITGKYLIQNDFNRRIWKIVLEGLYADSSIEEYLSPYHLRHSFITAMFNKGMKLDHIASICGNSSEVIVKHYLASKEKQELEQADIPNLF